MLIQTPKRVVWVSYFTEKSVWLIRHGEKDMTKATYYMESFREMNFDWALSENGLLQARSVAEVLREQYFVFPFKNKINGKDTISFRTETKTTTKIITISQRVFIVQRRFFFSRRCSKIRSCCGHIFGAFTPLQRVNFKRFRISVSKKKA
jgi:hypothetical protein